MVVASPPATPDRGLAPEVFSQQVYDFLNWFQTAVPQFNDLAVGSNGTGTFSTITLTTKALNALGTVALPSYSFTGDTDTGIWSPTANTVAFSTAGVEAVRINAAGAFLVGQYATSSPGVGNITTGMAVATNGQGALSATAVAALRVNRNTSNGAAVEFYREGLAVGSISVTTTGTAYNVTSDYRLKNVLEDLPNFDPLATVRELAAAQNFYSWAVSPETVELGWLAHKLQDVAPHAVTGEKDAVDENGVAVLQQRDDTKLIPVLVAALSRALDKIDALENRLYNLERA